MPAYLDGYLCHLAMCGWYKEPTSRILLLHDICVFNFSNNIVTSYYIPIYKYYLDYSFLVDEAATEEGLDMFKSKGKST